jgi:hypothetical protein
METPQEIIDAGMKIRSMSIREIAEMNQIEQQTLQRKNDIYFLAALSTLRKHLPFEIPYRHLNFMDENGVPYLYCFEALDEKTYFLWDARHDLDEMKIGYGYELGQSAIKIPTRMEIFRTGVIDVNPEYLALELTRDNGQNIIDAYIDGRIDSGELNLALQDDHIATSLFSDYSILLNHCVSNDIKIKCVAPDKATYMNPGSIDPEIKELIEKRDSFEYGIERAEVQREVDEKIAAAHDDIIAPALADLTKQGRTMLIIGAGHRMNLPKKVTEAMG